MQKKSSDWRPIKVWVAPGVLLRLTRAADAAGMPRSEYCRALLVEGLEKRGHLTPAPDGRAAS